MSESGDYDPGPWKGHDFASAYKSYDAHAGRSYSKAKADSVSVASLIPESLETDSDAPVVVCCDVTGSMGDWPKTIFSKLPYLDKEGKEYMGPGMKISFVAVGDMFSDDYPLQVQPFVEGLEMETCLKKLVVEGGGGSGGSESYDLPALYFARNVTMPKAIRKPLFIFIGDEMLYNFIDEEGAKKYCYTDLKKRLSVEDVFEELKAKYSVYLVQKTYASRGDSSDSGPTKQWTRLLGEDHVVLLPDASRVVDVIFGIMAKETGRIDYFVNEIGERQKPDQIAVVMKSLKTVHSMKKLPAPSKDLGKSKSVTRRSKDGDDDGKSKKTKSLL